MLALGDPDTGRSDVNHGSKPRKSRCPVSFERSSNTRSASHVDTGGDDLGAKPKVLTSELKSLTQPPLAADTRISPSTPQSLNSSSLVSASIPAPNSQTSILPSMSSTLAKQTKRKPGAPRGRRRKRPIVFSDLPLEIMQLVARFLLNPTYPYTEGYDSVCPLLSPFENLYVSDRTLTHSAGLAQRYGGIPRGVRDVMNFSRTCTFGKRACAEVLEHLGGIDGKGGKSEEEYQVLRKKRILYITVSEDTHECMKRIRRVLTSCRERLETVVVHKCHHHRNTHRNSSCLSVRSVAPFQTDYENISELPNASTVIGPDSDRGSSNLHPRVHEREMLDGPVFPSLSSLQLGPHLCESCTHSFASLFVQSRFAISNSSRRSSGRGPQWDISQAPRPQDPFDYKYIQFSRSAAQHLSALTIHLPIPVHFYARMTVQDTLRQIMERMSPEVLGRLKVLNIWLEANEREWGGFGANGGSTCVVTKKVDIVESEIERAVDEETKRREEDSLKKRETKEERERRLLAKFNLNAKTALRGHPLTAVSLPKVPIVKVSNEQSVQQSRQESVTSSLTALTGEDDSRAGTVASDIGMTADTLSGDVSSSGDADTISTTDYPIIADPETTGGTRSRADRSSQLRIAMNQRKKRDEAYKNLLAVVAFFSPNLVALQILRRGPTKNDIVEGIRTLEEYAASYVEPVSKMKKLIWLDLDLVVVGRKEVENFPLGLKPVNTQIAKASTKERPKVNRYEHGAEGLNEDLAKRTEIRRLVMDQRVEQAIREGDEWRRRVLEFFVAGRPRQESEQQPGLGEQTDLGGSESSPSAIVSHLDEAIEYNDESPKWPKTLRGGWVFSVDLKKRAKKRGILFHWARGEMEGDMGKDRGEIIIHDPTHVTLL